MKKFTNLYPVSKTLRFELIPIGKTKEHLENSDLISQDEHRAESYKKVKKIIDRYHKQFIENVLSNTELIYKKEGNSDSLEEYFQLYIVDKKTDNEKKQLENIQDKLRKQIIKAFKDNDLFKRIDKKELIREDILSIIEPEEKSIVEEFSDFTTYFTGFHENRKNMYSEEKKSTSIAYRLIHENLPKFVDNIFSFIKISKTSVADYLQILYSEMEDALKEKDDSLDFSDIEEMFRLDYYNSVLTQKKIDLYNSIIGGMTKKDGTQIKGINNYVKEYNDQIKSNETKLPKLKPLFKQILSDREGVSWLPEEFNSDQELLRSVKDFYCDLSNNVITPLKDILYHVADYDEKGLFIPNDQTITSVSQSLYGDWSIIRCLILEDIRKNNPQNKKENNEKYEERITKLFKANKYFSFHYLNTLLSEHNYNITSYFKSFGVAGKDENNDVFKDIDNAYSKVDNLLNVKYPEKDNLAQDKDNVNKLKTFLDSIKRLQHFIKPLSEIENQGSKDERFYGDITILFEELDKITPLYNKVRNRMTKKPYSTEKIKLNFENSTLLNGWDVNKERDYNCAILKKNDLYYLAIMRKGYGRIFIDSPKANEEDIYQKMEYKLLPDAFKMLPKVFFSKSREAEFSPSKEIISIREKGSFKKGASFNIKDCHKFIDYYKSSIEKHNEWRQFDFKFTPTEKYEDISGFFREVDQMGYKISFRDIPSVYIDKMVEEGKLLLFQIYNKDFSKYTKGSPNLHTLYWKMLFDENNLSDVIYKLNGQAEIFYRKKSITYQKPTHPAGQQIKNKNLLNKKVYSQFEYDLIKDRRYTLDKFQFHVPITMNFKANGIKNINPIVNDFIKKTSDLHFIGIDRGERHLLYIVVIDSKGKIKEQLSLNIIENEYKNNKYLTDYHSLLKSKENQIHQERQSWSAIENIKELKQGYLSQVIHRIVNLMVKYKALVVLEDLNMGFKRGRQKVESSVYQQFEKALIDKLNYLVDKQKEPNEVGGLLNALQLTCDFSSFKDMGKQNGFLFYIPAWNTSKIDPVTGFVDLLHPKYESVGKSQEFFNKFKEIKYNNEKGWYEFVLDYSDFTTKAEGTRTKWTLCTHGTRIKTYRNKDKNSSWDSVEVDLTNDLKKLFDKYDIPSSDDMKEYIIKQTDKHFFEELTKLLALTLQMRNSVTDTDIDYLISPVANENGEFYDSRTCNDDLPKNADANGAYNIARKGLWCAMQIREALDPKKMNFVISNKEWLSFAQTKPYLND